MNPGGVEVQLDRGIVIFREPLSKLDPPGSEGLLVAVGGFARE